MLPGLPPPMQTPNMQSDPRNKHHAPTFQATCSAALEIHPTTIFLVDQHGKSEEAKSKTPECPAPVHDGPTYADAKTPPAGLSSCYRSQLLSYR